MPNRENYLGEFEQVVMLALAAQEKRATGREVYQHLKSTVGRDASVTQIYVTLARLEDKGYVSSIVDDSQRRALRRYSLEPAGLEQLRRSVDQLQRLWAQASTHPGFESP